MHSYLRAVCPHEVAIRTQGLTKRFGRQVAVNGLDLEIQSGEVFGLICPNSAGKLP